ncbi:hypothetical protein EHEL_100980 [Encephalitozoon hellem ATCC 50504]|uniref:Uncharacterized protein n=1 Tax=Encephalitozoon hellem TaxID=27973 RepID=A0A9Q9C4U5_ENCHE|nr:uncharacterized protein EHEL_100980 [Encephalitozoon hellem ATCC 50504]AFM99191.1 hypothetical protein EHEL_100980 [Encephalitozoon hellem ATCC 50504]UTX44176.1 hypothetical protein GPU96_10g19660 [Encephalitozoon hellem]WEL39667.1 hypothetical protein PFJ87_10g01150 [Encephalitozoon hellem]|eukprot:XP_003888172.1 hypothetical protein EHEL_100980 [Encephalitozoon hellem ATCC 50504]
MSRFFESVDEEREESNKTKVKEKVYEESERQSKKEKRLYDLQCRVMELEEEENQKVFDKQLKKMLADVRKVENHFGKDLPPFLKKFLTSPKAYTKSHRKAIDELLSKYESKEEIQMSQESKKDEEEISRDLSKILVIKDTEMRKKELREFKDSTRDVAMKAKALITLLSVYVKSKDGVEIMKTINELLDCLTDGEENAARSVLLENIDFYLEALYETLDSSKIAPYGNLLKRLSAIDREAVEGRVLQFEFFKLGRAVETAHPLFRLLYIDRVRGYKESREYYKSIEGTVGEGKVEQEVLQEFGMSSFRNGDFEMSFKILSKFSGVKGFSHEIPMKLLCVILNDRIKGTPIHNEFLEGFKGFGRNRLCLPSGDSVFEVYRSFYLLNMLDAKGAGNIVRRFCEGFEEEIWFKDFVESRIKG